MSITGHFVFVNVSFIKQLNMYIQSVGFIFPGPKNVKRALEHSSPTGVTPKSKKSLQFRTPHKVTPRKPMVFATKPGEKTLNMDASTNTDTLESKNTKKLFDVKVIIIVSPLKKLYPQDTKYMGGYIGFTLSVRPSVDFSCEHYFLETIGQKFMKLHSNDGY